MLLTDKHSFRSRRSRKRQQKRQVIKTGVAALLFVLIACGVAYGSRLDAVTISAVSVHGGETVSHDAVKARVEHALSGTYALIIPKRFSYLYPHDAVAASVAGIARVRDVEVSKTSRTGLSVSFTEYSPHGLWCDTRSASASTPPTCVFVDENGFAFAIAPTLDGGALLRYVQEGVQPAVGERVFTDGIVHVIEEFSDALAAKHNVRIKAVTETKDKDIVFHTSNGGDILIAHDADIQTIFDNLVSVLDSETFSKLSPSDFEYIDLRFGNKIYLKETGREALPENATVAE